MAWTYSLTYSQVNDYSAKDALASGQAEKIILGSDIDDELSGIATALNSKLDSGSVSSQAEAEAGTDTESVMTPQGVQYWGDANAGIVGDLRALADPAADRILFWDNSGSAAAFLTVSTGLAISTTNLSLSHLGIESLVDPNADRILFWDDSAGASAWLSLGTGLAISTTTLSLSHLGIESLVDPNADRILFWDDSAGASAWLTVTGGLEVSTTNLQIADQAASSSVPVSLSSGTLGFDLSSITELPIESLTQSADGFLISDAGVLKVMPYDQSGMKVQTAQTTQTLALTDANTIMEFDGTATLTIPVAATHGWDAGSAVIICVDHASQVVTVTAAGTVVLNSVYNPGGTAAASDAVRAGGTACLVYLGGEEWFLAGDIQD